MIKLHEFNETVFNSGCLAVLDKASEVALFEDLIQPHKISFNYPCIDDKAKEIKENRIVSVEGQGYRLDSVIKDVSEHKAVLHCEGTRIFYADAERVHFPNVKDMPGLDPYVVLKTVFNFIPHSVPFHIMTDDELADLGMERIGKTGTTIDFFSMDKVNPYTVCQAIIEAYGKGEIFTDNYNIAIVERIGADRGVRLSLGKNLQNLSIQRQTTDLCTRLYPYGSSDLTIKSINRNIPYIESPEAISKYGIICGYKNYDEYTDVNKLKQHAEWDLFGDENENRLDTPRLTITCDMNDLAKLSDYGEAEKVSLGDTVHVYDEDGTEYVKRVISLTYYPYSSRPPRVTIGVPSNTNYFYSRWQQKKLLTTLKKNSSVTTNKIRASTVSGSTANVKKVSAESAEAEELTVAATATIAALILNNVDVGAVLAELQNQIDELKNNQNGGTNEDETEP